MKNLLAVSFLLVLAAPVYTGAQPATPGTVHIIGGCVDRAKIVIGIFGEQNAGPATLYLICNRPEWDKVRRMFDKPSNVLAFTILKSRTTVIGPDSLDDPLLLRATVAHEAKHLACSCTLNEAY